MASQVDYHQPGLTNPASRVDVVTPNDSTDLANVARALYVGVTGNIKVTTAGGDAVTFSNVAVGILQVRCSRVWSTGTSASLILALW